MAAAFKRPAPPTKPCHKLKQQNSKKAKKPNAKPRIYNSDSEGENAQTEPSEPKRVPKKTKIREERVRSKEAESSEDKTKETKKNSKRKRDFVESQQVKDSR
jgi:hypothetical protein